MDDDAPYVTLEEMAGLVVEERRRVPTHECALVGISGIDASGKGFVSEKLASSLRESGLNVAVLNVDLWLAAVDKRYDQNRPAEHFYRNGIRLDEMFARVIRPLRGTRSLNLTASLFRQTGEAFTCTYRLQHVDVAIVEGIFLFRRDLRKNFDLAFWIECSFEKALERAIRRNQEGLPPEGIVHDFETIYFPAQRLHMALDAPRASATGLYLNE